MASRNRKGEGYVCHSLAVTHGIKAIRPNRLLSQIGGFIVHSAPPLARIDHAFLACFVSGTSADSGLNQSSSNTIRSFFAIAMLPVSARIASAIATSP